LVMALLFYTTAFVTYSFSVLLVVKTVALLCC
jgi:hypothetical protein